MKHKNNKGNYKNHSVQSEKKPSLALSVVKAVVASGAIGAGAYFAINTGFLGASAGLPAAFGMSAAILSATGIGTAVLAVGIISTMIVRHSAPGSKPALASGFLSAGMVVGAFFSYGIPSYRYCDWYSCNCFSVSGGIAAFFTKKKQAKYASKDQLTTLKSSVT